MRAITKTVKAYGNSGGVYLPRSWVGGTVKIELVDEPFEPKNVLAKIPMEHAVSVILYGSYARKEAAEGSDIDIILVTDEPIVPRLERKYDVQVKTVKETRNAMVHDPVFHKVILDESIALVNHQFLDNLKEEKLEPGGIMKRVGLAESSLKICKGLFEAGSEDIVYPLIMRLKEMLILECLLANKKYSTTALQKEISSHLQQKEFSDAMNIYRAERNGKKPEKQLPGEAIGKLISLLEAKIQHVKQKAVEEGHRIH